MHLYIKNMVCPRCITAVRNELDAMKLPIKSVELGEAIIENEPLPEQLLHLQASLKSLALKLLKTVRAG